MNAKQILERIYSAKDVRNIVGCWVGKVEPSQQEVDKLIDDSGKGTIGEVLVANACTPSELQLSVLPSDRIAYKVLHFHGDKERIQPGLNLHQIDWVDNDGSAIAVDHILPVGKDRCSVMRAKVGDPNFVSQGNSNTTVTNSDIAAINTRFAKEFGVAQRYDIHPTITRKP